jgi:hypothetical protein
VPAPGLVELPRSVPYALSDAELLPLQARVVPGFVQPGSGIPENAPTKRQ